MADDRKPPAPALKGDDLAARDHLVTALGFEPEEADSVVHRWKSIGVTPTAAIADPNRLIALVRLRQMGSFPRGLGRDWEVAPTTGVFSTYREMRPEQFRGSYDFDDRDEALQERAAMLARAFFTGDIGRRH